MMYSGQIGFNELIPSVVAKLTTKSMIVVRSVSTENIFFAVVVSFPPKDGFTSKCQMPNFKVYGRLKVFHMFSQRSLSLRTSRKYLPFASCFHLSFPVG